MREYFYKYSVNSFVIVYITNPSKDEAKKIATHLLDKKLIACANILGPTDSIYYWKGKLADEKEYILLAKTPEKSFEKVKREVEKIHSYTIPCIIKIPVTSNASYFNWLLGEVVK